VCGDMVGLYVRTVQTVHRVWWASSRPIIFFERAIRSSYLSRLLRSHRRTTEHLESNESDGLVDFGRKTTCIKKLVSSRGVENGHVRMYESTVRAKRSAARPISLVDMGASTTIGV
jgi:hypothetical protein